MKFKNVMIDLETLGTTADAIIMSIGATRFNLDGVVEDKGFYTSVSIDSNLELGRRLSEDTLLWWLKEPAAALNVFHEEKISLPAALEQLSDWLSDGDMVVWANGPSFDIAMLEHAYDSIRMEVPWKFSNARCVRTYRDLPGAKAIPKPTLGVKHNALADAFNQATHMVAIHQALFPAKAAEPAPVNKMVRGKAKPKA